MSEKTAEPRKGFLSFVSAKKTEFLVIIGIAGVILALFLGNFGLGSSEKSEDYSQFEKWCLSEQARAENLLGKIKGAGKVRVLIAYESSAEKIYATKTVSKTSGGVTTVTEETVYSGGKPLLVTETAPKIRGIVVVAEGAGNARVKLEIVRAVMTLYEVEASAVEVFAAG